MGGVLGEDECSIGFHTFGGFVGMPSEKRIEEKVGKNQGKSVSASRDGRDSEAATSSGGSSQKTEDLGSWLIEGHVISL